MAHRNPVTFYTPPPEALLAAGDWTASPETVRRRMAERLRHVEEAIQLAAQASGRSRAEIQIVLATKTVPVDRLRIAAELGLTCFGENRAQELRAKAGAPELAAYPLEWHFIGYLQRNKIKDVCPRITLLHSLDRLELARSLDEWLRRHGGLGERGEHGEHGEHGGLGERGGLEQNTKPGKRSKDGENVPSRLKVLIEVNTSGEPSKHGVSPADAIELARRVAELPTLSLRGLMTVASATGSESEVRRQFASLRELAARIAALRLPGVDLQHLSMGMSRDFPLAIAEGATLIRLGTAILGPRPAEPGAAIPAAV